MQLPKWTRFLSGATKYEVKTLTNVRVHVGTWPAVSLHRRNVVTDETGMIETCTTSSTIEMHADRSKFGSKNETASNGNDTTRGTMIIMVPSTTNLTDNIPLKGGAMKEESKPSLMT
jgi:hypothetical protein